MLDNNTQKNRTATQRLEDLENAAMATFQALNQMANDLMTLKEAVKLLGNKVESIAILSNLSVDSINTQMIANSAQKLKEAVDSMVLDGNLVAAELSAPDSFLVMRELDDQGVVINPRIQFGAKHVQEEFRQKVIGLKVGESVNIRDDGSRKLELLEVYSIVEKNQEEIPAAPEAPALEAAPAEQSLEAPAAAPAADSSSQTA